MVINCSMLISPNFECCKPACFSSLYFLKLKYNRTVAGSIIIQLYFEGFIVIGNMLKKKKTVAICLPLSVVDLVCIAGNHFGEYIKKTIRLNEWFSIIIDRLFISCSKPDSHYVEKFFLPVCCHLLYVSLPSICCSSLQLQ